LRFEFSTESICFCCDEKPQLLSDTDLRLAFMATVREVLANSPKEFDPRKILGTAKDAMKEVANSKMRLFGSSGKA